MKYIEIQNSIINLENIEIIEKNEKDQKIYYRYSDESLYRSIDYENVRDNINEEKTELEKDYEKLKKALIPEKEDEINLKDAIEILEKRNNQYEEIVKYLKKEKNLYMNKIGEITDILYESRIFPITKIKRIKEVLKNDRG